MRPILVLSVIVVLVVSTVQHSKMGSYVGGWLPAHQKIQEEWLKDLIEEVSSTDGDVKLLPVVEDFKTTIETDGKINMLAHQMMSGQQQVQDYLMMLKLINATLTRAPEFPFKNTIYYIFEESQQTQAGFAFFLDDKVNAHLKKILKEWGVYLKSPASAYVLSDAPTIGWFSEEALQGMPNFTQEFQCDPTAPHYGFTSWDDFFTRVFREGARPVASPNNDDIIVNACEAIPFNLQENVSLRDWFWIKSQPYSLEFLLANDPLTEQFVGGTIYQGFLNSTAYHRWHSPVSGTIVKTVLVDGAYYSALLTEGLDWYSGQGYLPHVAARALIFIRADNPAIGLMCFVSVGMDAVSSNEVTVFEGQHVTKGQELGMFHFGGSTHCLIFRPGVKLSFDLRGQTLYAQNATNIIPVNAKIATVIH